MPIRLTMCAGLVVLLMGCSSPATNQGSDGLGSSDLPMKQPEPLAVNTSDFDGVAESDPRFPVPLRQSFHKRNRTGYKLDPIMVERENAYLCWLTAFGQGYFYIQSIDLLYEAADGKCYTLYSQVWEQNQAVAGGRWAFTPTTWFAKQLELGTNLSCFRKDRGMLLIDTRNRPSEVHHVWLSTWPHMDLPAGAKRIGMRVRGQAYGEGLFHFGMDRYLTPTVQQPKKGITVWEVMNSSSYGQEHGLIDKTIWTRVREVQ